jgi:hypothetical protein
MRPPVNITRSEQKMDIRPPSGMELEDGFFQVIHQGFRIIGDN